MPAVGAALTCGVYAAAPAVVSIVCQYTEISVFLVFKMPAWASQELHNTSTMAIPCRNQNFLGDWNTYVGLCLAFGTVVRFVGDRVGLIRFHRISEPA
jgi:hypothetical protein